jgi:uncharacterized Zn-finger protein
MAKPSVRDYQELGTSREVVVKTRDLPLHCPTDDNALWCGHPRVFLPIHESSDKTSRCPYCGTLYRLVD